MSSTSTLVGAAVGGLPGTCAAAGSTRESALIVIAIASAKPPAAAANDLIPSVRIIFSAPVAAMVTCLAAQGKRCGMDKFCNKAVRLRVLGKVTERRLQRVHAVEVQAIDRQNERAHCLKQNRSAPAFHELNSEIHRNPARLFTWSRPPGGTGGSPRV